MITALLCRGHSAGRLFPAHGASLCLDRAGAIRQPFLRLYLTAEHEALCVRRQHAGEHETTLTNWLVRKLAWNMPFHAEHHAYPGVPFHQLPEFHALIERHLKVVEPGYVSFHEKYIETLC